MMPTLDLEELTELTARALRRTESPATTVSSEPEAKAMRETGEAARDDVGAWGACCISAASARRPVSMRPDSMRGNKWPYGARPAQVAVRETRTAAGA